MNAECKTMDNRKETHGNIFSRRLSFLVHRFLPFLLSAFPTSTAAHEVQSVVSPDPWSTWSGEPVTIIALALSGGLYGRGLYRLWSVAGVGHGVTRGQAVAFATGWLMLVFALLSPLHTLGALLFSAHMVQHEVLMIIAAPLMILSRPLLALLWGLPKPLQRTVGRCGQSFVLQASWRVLTDPFVAWGLHTVAVWMWHIPVLYQATLTDEFAHTAQHASFFGTALLFWWALLYGRYGQRGYGIAVLYVFTTAVHTSVLGALLTFSSSPWYPAYTETLRVGNLTALEDQQLGGVIMWVPAGAIYVLAGLGFFAAWLRTAEQRTSEHERQRGPYQRKLQPFTRHSR